MAEPWELAGRDEGQRLVRRLEDLTALVEDVAPGRLVAGHARVQHEVVFRPATAIGSNWIEPKVLMTARTARTPGTDLAGAMKWRARRNRRAASAVTFTWTTLTQANGRWILSVGFSKERALAADRTGAKISRTLALALSGSDRVRVAHKDLGPHVYDR